MGVGMVYPVSATAKRMLGCRPKLEKVTAGVSVCVGVVSVIENGLRPKRENPVRDSCNRGILTQRDAYTAIDAPGPAAGNHKSGGMSLKAYGLQASRRLRRF